MSLSATAFARAQSKALTSAWSTQSWTIAVESSGLLHKRDVAVTVAKLKGKGADQMPQTLTDSFRREWGEFASIVTRSRSAHAAVGRWQPTKINASAARNARFKVGVRLYQTAKTAAQKKRALKIMIDNWPD